MHPRTWFCREQPTVMSNNLFFQKFWLILRRFTSSDFESWHGPRWQDWWIASLINVVCANNFGFRRSHIKTQIISYNVKPMSHLYARQCDLAWFVCIPWVKAAAWCCAHQPVAATGGSFGSWVDSTGFLSRNIFRLLLGGPGARGSFGFWVAYVFSDYQEKCNVNYTHASNRKATNYTWSTGW